MKQKPNFFIYQGMQQSRKSLAQSYSNKNFKTRSYTPEVFSNSLFESISAKSSPGPDLQLSIDKKQLQSLLPSMKRSSVTQVQSPDRGKISTITLLMQKIHNLLHKHDGIIKNMMPSLYQKIRLQRNEYKNRKLNFQLSNIYSYKYPEMELQLLQHKQKEYESKIKQLENEKKLLNLANPVQHDTIKQQIKYYKEQLAIVASQYQVLQNRAIQEPSNQPQSEEISQVCTRGSKSSMTNHMYNESETQTPLDVQAFNTSNETAEKTSQTENLKFNEKQDNTEVKRNEVEKKNNDINADDDDLNPIEENYEHDGVLCDDSFDTATENTVDFDDSEFHKFAGDFKSVPNLQKLHKDEDNEVILEIDHVHSYNNIQNIDKAVAILSAAFSGNNLDELDNGSFKIPCEDENDLNSPNVEQQTQELQGSDVQKPSMKAYNVINNELANNENNQKENVETI